MKVKIGILGCGAIGSRIAQSLKKELKGICPLTALYDRQHAKAVALQKTLSQTGLIKKSLRELLNNCDLMVESVNAPNAATFVRQALKAKRHVLAMSVGKLLNADDLFTLANKMKRSLLVPSGAIAGIDAIKAASLASLENITLTTRKPPAGLANNSYFHEKGISLGDITEETVVFEGDVDTAVKFFPQNINVAATLALASRARSKITIRIMTSPEYTRNTHEIEAIGNFGRIVTRTENEVCPDNPKTSYLAVLSGIQTLKEFCLGVKIGT